MAALFSAFSNKRTRTDEGGSSATASLSSGRFSSSGSPGPASSGSYAQAAQAARNKRSQVAPPTFLRPQLIRGTPVVEVPTYASMECPAPAVVSPHHLYVDLRQADITVKETLWHVHSMARADVLGFEMLLLLRRLREIPQSVHS